MALQTILSICGSIGLAYIAFSIYSTISLYIRSSSLSRYHHSAPGKQWALVTGASDGIGRAFVDKLLAQKFNVLMHGRNPSKLAGIQAELAKQHPSLEIRTVIADASATGKGIDAVTAAVGKLPGKLTVLINNVGGTPPGPEYEPLSNMTEDYIDACINMNARFVTQITRALLPTLEKNTPSLIMNIGSGAGSMGMPFISVYSASKGYDEIFTRALAREMTAMKTGIEVIGILVGSVSTASNPIAEGFFACSAETLARVSLDRVGCGKPMVWGWWRHGLQVQLFSLFPASVTTRLINDMMTEMRNKAYALREKNQ